MLANEAFSEEARKLALGDCKSFTDGSWRAAHESLAFLTDTHHLPFWDPGQLTYVEHRIGINRRTGATGIGKLFTAEVVSAGLPFQIQIVVDHGTHALEATRLLLKALAGFNLDPVDAPIQLGSGTNHGWGRMACLFPTVRVQSWTPDTRRDIAPEELDIEKEVSVHFARDHGRIASGLAEGREQIGLESSRTHGGALDTATVAA
ncbi:MAG: hypothetical protein JW829_08365 [Pirellulales bacterium]|nr:hypothetical protein [Pirellulales bacterium]